jgi:hypothetical protein
MTDVTNLTIQPTPGGAVLMPAVPKTDIELVRLQCLQIACSLTNVPDPLEASKLGVGLADIVLEGEHGGPKTSSRLSVAYLVLSRWRSTISAAGFLQAVEGMVDGAIADVPPVAGRA